jgi:uncharacterized protein (DUF2147 family)
MKKVMMLCVFCLFLAGLGAMDITGYWKTVDDTTGEVKSICGVYEKNNRVYGRLLVLFKDGEYLEDYRNPQKIAEEVKGKPFYSGLDIIWDMKESGSRYKKGKIMDPENGNIYDCEMWLENGNLMVRGSILFIGRNQTWVPMDGSEPLPSGLVLPPLNSFTPVIPQK